MPRYYLNIRDGEELIEDPDGLDLPSLEAALAAAVEGARDILAAHLRGGRVLNGQKIEITNEAGSLLATLPLKEVLRIS